MESTAAKTEVFYDVEDLHGLLIATLRELLLDDEIYVDVGVDEVSVGAASHSALDAHQAVLLKHTHREI